jgi:hypothetical protein
MLFVEDSMRSNRLPSIISPTLATVDGEDLVGSLFLKHPGGSIVLHQVLEVDRDELRPSPVLLYQTGLIPDHLYWRTHPRRMATIV